MDFILPLACAFKKTHLPECIQVDRISGKKRPLTDFCINRNFLVRLKFLIRAQFLSIDNQWPCHLGLLGAFWMINSSQGSTETKPSATKPCFLGSPDGGGKGDTFTLLFPCMCTTSAVKGVVFVDIILNLFGFYILLIKTFQFKVILFWGPKDLPCHTTRFLKTDSTLFPRIFPSLVSIIPLPELGPDSALSICMCWNYPVPKTTPSPNTPCECHFNTKFIFCSPSLNISSFSHPCRVNK